MAARKPAAPKPVAKKQAAKKETKASTAKPSQAKSTSAGKATAKVAKTKAAAKPPSKTSSSGKPAPAKTKGKTAKATKDKTPQAEPTTDYDIPASPEDEPMTDSVSPKGHKANQGLKRKASEQANTTAKRAATKKVRELAKINSAPTTRLHVYVFGEGTAGELGLGTSKKAVDVKRPRLNPHLPADTVGVVQVAVGGMHCAALTHDNQILSWGVNDQGALGRDTTWEGGFKAIEANGEPNDSDTEEEDDNGVNPHEAVPKQVEDLPEDEVFVQVAAADSASFALTETGLVYGWGTFRGSNGVMGFCKDDVTYTKAEENIPYSERRQLVLIRPRPILIEGLSKIKQLECGANHVLALDSAGNVFAFGAGEQFQLGRKLVDRHVPNGLVPRQFGLPVRKIKAIAAGSDHSLAIDKSGNVWAWGLNSFNETGLRESAEDAENFVMRPAKIKRLQGRDIVAATGGSHHSAVVDSDGSCLVWGRVDGNQLGIDVSKEPEANFILDSNKSRRILKVPTRVPGFDAEMVNAANDTTIAITRDGHAFSWGFSVNFQTGQGTSDDVEIATQIDNTAVRSKKLNWAGLGGQFAVLTAPAGEEGER